MVLIATEQITLGGVTRYEGQRFETDDQMGRYLLDRRLARCGLPPRILYETKVVTPEHGRACVEMPLVTCLCVTRNRREWLPKSIEYYRSQTYANRELLIIADGDDVRDLVPADPSIRLIQLDRALHLGTKRNYGCERAVGSVIAVWDDDDYSAPGRLSHQVPKLMDSGKGVLKYTGMRFTNGAKWWQFNGAEEMVLGTSLCFRRDYWARNPFPDKEIGEDHVFGNAARAKGELVFAGDAGELMHATIHPGNTCQRSLAGPVWQEL